MALSVFIANMFEMESDLVAEITTVILEVELGQLESTDGRKKLTNAIKTHYYHRRNSVNNTNNNNSSNSGSSSSSSSKDNEDNNKKVSDIISIVESKGSSTSNNIEQDKQNDNTKDIDDENLHNLIHQIEDKLHTHLRPIFFILPRSHDNKYTEYEITATYHTGHSHTIIKRYSQFDKLQRKLQRQLKAEGDTIITLPHLPPKYMSKSKSMSQAVVASRKDGLLMFLNLMVCILEGGVSDILQDVFWDFLEHRFVHKHHDNGNHVYDIVKR